MRSTPGLRVKMVGQPMLSAIAELPAILAEVMVGLHPGLLRDHCRPSAHQHIGRVVLVLNPARWAKAAVNLVKEGTHGALCMMVDSVLFLLSRKPAIQGNEL